MKNFKSSVPLLVQAKLHSLAMEIKCGWRDVVTAFGNGNIESMNEERIEEIEGNYVSGWMPRQDGGFSVNQIFYSTIDSSSHFTKKQTDFVNDQIENCFSAFLSDKGITEDEFNAQYDLDTGNEESRQEFCEYENEWFRDGALFSVQMFMEGYNGKLFSFDRDPEQIVTIRVSINYKSEYFAGRDAEDIKQIIMTESEFMETDNADIIKQITNQG